MDLKKIGVREIIIILLSLGILIAAFFAVYVSTKTPPLPDDITQRINKNNAVKPPALPSDIAPDSNTDSYQYQKNIEKAVEANEAENYFQAVFHYRKALTFSPKDTATRQQLIEMLEKSCEEDGNDMHCLSVAKETERLKLLKETGFLKPDMPQVQ